jgi:DNA-binding NarL/FixJ family response regulator
MPLTSCCSISDYLTCPESKPPPALQLYSGRTPIVVLTGHDDEALAMRCIDLGAQDYLSKSDIRPVPLRRSINYAINRSYEQEIRDLRDTLDRYREMCTGASSAEPSRGTAPAIRDRLPEAFTTWVDAYAALLRRHSTGWSFRPRSRAMR